MQASTRAGSSLSQAASAVLMHWESTTLQVVCPSFQMLASKSVPEFGVFGFGIRRLRRSLFCTVQPLDL